MLVAWYLGGIGSFVIMKRIFVGSFEAILIMAGSRQLPEPQNCAGFSLILLLGLDPWPLDPLDPPKLFKDFKGFYVWGFWMLAAYLAILATR